MENKYDEHIQKLLDAGDIAGEYKESDELYDYKTLYKLLQQDIMVELPVNFSSKIESKIVARRERPLKIILAVLIGFFLSAAAYMATGVYSSLDVISLVRLFSGFTWVLLVALPAIGYFIIADYRNIKHTNLQ